MSATSGQQQQQELKHCHSLVDSSRDNRIKHQKGDRNSKDAAPEGTPTTEPEMPEQNGRHEFS
jgi:hypothetical protein